jgi:hypothetical protein
VIRFTVNLNSLKAPGDRIISGSLFLWRFAFCTHGAESAALVVEGGVYVIIYVNVGEVFCIKGAQNYDK